MSMRSQVRPLMVVAGVLALANLAFEVPVLFLVPAFGLVALSLAETGSVPVSALRRRREQRRRRSGLATQVRRDLVDKLPDAAVLLSLAGQVTHANARANEVLGECQAGQFLSSIVRNPALAEGISRACEPGAEPYALVYNERVPIERKIAATIARLEVGSAGPGSSRQPERSADGANSELLVIFRDVSNEERLNRVRSDFVAHASHELRTPLASVIGYIDTMQGAARGDESARERFLAVMAEQARRMQRLIDDLSQLSRVEMDVHVRPHDRVELVHLVEAVIEAMAPLAQEGGVVVKFTSAIESAEVEGDEDQLFQVFQNLLQNAIRYGGSGGRVDVQLTHREGSDNGSDAASKRSPVSQRRTAAGRYVVSIRDFGPGIASHHLPRLCERFYRVDAVASKRKGGTGLGLAIVKHIVKRHRGDLEIDSRLGEGATFSVALIAAPGD